MKKILSLVICLITMISCSTSYCIGDITTFNTNGDTLKVYKDITLQDNNLKRLNVNKPFGINFYDKTTNNWIVISASTPYTIKYNVKQVKFSDYNTHSKYIKAVKELNNELKY